MSRMFMLAGILGALASTVPAGATVLVPAKAKTIKGEFVTAYDECLTPDQTWIPGGRGACTPVVSDPACGFGPEGSGKYSLTVSRTDVKVKASFKGLTAGCEGNSLAFVAAARTTTTDCDLGDCTVETGFFLGFCTVSLGKCSVNTTLETAYVTELFRNGQTSNIELHEILVGRNFPFGPKTFTSGLRVGP